MTSDVHPSSRKSAIYQPELDGLRAIAIGFVLLFHCLAVPTDGATAWLSWIVGLMWCGVDLFFVLSGFLITGILLDTRDDSKRWSTFLARRTLRVFPLYYFWLVVVFWVLPQFIHTTPITPQQAEPWCWTYTFNWYIWEINQFVYPATINHFWSLAVEEQFYLLWPLVVFTIPVRHLGTICLVGICASMAWKYNLYFSSCIHSFPIYTATPLRVDALLGGGLVAWMVRNPAAVNTRLLHSLLTGVGLLVLLALMHLRGLENLPGIHKFAACLLTSFFALVFPALLRFLISHPNSVPVRFLSWRIFRPVAKLSYGLYVCHYIIFYIALRGYREELLLASKNSGLPAWFVLFAVTVSLSGLVSAILYLLVERPMLSLKRHFSYSQSE
ncbi:acyltransferase family protein [Thalassoroseus pseudoceratinae]|uniref:acyltransferase family protein n=1 Tax=Thalassoroseus pseudoceratinae TaxID=2713176 RepID=UPI001421403A|nr:acyltransferase [Thalassoroseus pseudoceratinae]